ncbi:MAG TPA: transcription elongation factor GreA [Dehalococcoidia bacterium]|nr:transcription elongation factor GreA [Dehalococcoidia bacterium]
MGQKKFLLTPNGLAKIERELEHLRTVRRPEVADKIKRAREMGGTENNAEYEDAKNEQSFIEGRILAFENTIKNATIIETTTSPGIVELGDTILIENQDGKIEQFVLVGSAESNPIEGKISNESPVGKALLGKKIGDTVKVKIPAGSLELRIIQVS